MSTERRTLSPAERALSTNTLAFGRTVNDLEARGVRIVKGLRDAPYGMRDFVFVDPDGNRIDVGEQRDA